MADIHDQVYRLDMEKAQLQAQLEAMTNERDLLRERERALINERGSLREELEAAKVANQIMSEDVVQAIADGHELADTVDRYRSAHRTKDALSWFREKYPKKESTGGP